MSDTITMVVKGIRGEKVFTLSSALYILRKQANKTGPKPSPWSIKKGEPYKFIDNEFKHIRVNRKGKKSIKQGSTTAGPEVPEQA